MYSRLFTLLLVFVSAAGLAMGQPCILTLEYLPPQPPLADSCLNGLPFADHAATIQVVWDSAGNGPDLTDPLFPLCNDPPTCDSGPPGTTNFNQFEFDGEEQGFGPGYFVSPLDFEISRPFPNPPLIYLRSCFSTGRWESNEFNLDSCAHGWDISFNCIESPCTTQTSFGENSPGLPAEYRLDAPFPNPFNVETVFHYELPRPEHVRLAVFDLTGRTVAVLSDGAVESGEHEVRFNGENLPSGMYLVRMQAGDFHQTRKIVLLK